MEEIQISVRRLIEFVGRSGDIDRGFFSNARAMEGMEAHKKVQSSYGETFRREVFLQIREEMEEFIFLVEGRADGISTGEEVIVDEIKSTTRSLEELSYLSNPLHWAQVKVYCYICAKERQLSEITAQLTYFQLESEEIKVIQQKFSILELKEFFFSLLSAYMEFSKRIVQWKTVRDESIFSLAFPFRHYRKGQRELAVAVYQTILTEGRIFIEAPTGIGKTMSTLFPGIKAIGEKKIDQIFYLLGRSTQKEAVKEAVERLSVQGLLLKCLILTAKEKICINDQVKCNPQECPYAKGHYDRVGECIIEIFDNESKFTSDIVETYAKRHQVCPFELQLDLVNFSDLIVGDYNYVFDPAVFLRRSFETSLSKYLFLVDEAHNLVDRGREMYSAELQKENLEECMDLIPQKYKRIQKYLREAKAEWDKLPTPPTYQYTETANLNDSLHKLVYSMTDYLTKEKGKEKYERVTELYFTFFSYHRILEYYNEDFITVIEKNRIKILCLDTGGIFQNILTRAQASAFFSATLSPLKYYAHLLGGGESAKRFRLNSPFDPCRLKVLQSTKIDTTYRHRRQNISAIVEDLLIFSKKEGNYIFFFPSYAYMKEVYEDYQKFDSQAIIQEPNMTERQRREFLKQFTIAGNLRAFAVMGGVFSEGIDLVGERLIGAAIITVGIPQISYERNLLRDHFNRYEKKGYEFAYIYPGMVKVAQSGGRVIRHQEDRGILLLIDLRFSQVPYRSLLPKHWDIDYYGTKEELRQKICTFWNNAEKEKNFSKNL